MELERQRPLGAPCVGRSPILLLFFISLLLFWTLPAIAQSRDSRKPKLIRDTDTAEGKENADAVVRKEPNPLLAEKSLNIGDFYFKRGNYVAAIQRYLEAREYQPNSIRAYEALARAYEKNGELAKAINAYKDFIDKNPDSPKSSEFRSKLSKLEQKSK
jgi:tetratricopeptide (TPR) repeat protein